MVKQPALFISHGVPDLPLSEHPAKKALQKLGRTLPRPSGIIVVSAHWQADQITVGASHGDAVTKLHDSYSYGIFPWRFSDLVWEKDIKRREENLRM